VTLKQRFKSYASLHRHTHVDSDAKAKV
jgi:hypothetical protein